MSRFRKNEAVEGNLLEHPAVLAWSKLQVRTVLPEAVIVLKESRKHPWERKSAVYRLEGVGPGGSAVVAKRCKQTAGAVEKAIYEKILPIARVPALGYYGHVEEQDNDYCWLFLEDARGIEFSSEVEEHRVAAAQWLGLLHRGTHHLEQAASLPDRGADHYLKHLESGHDRLMHIAESPVLASSDRETIWALVRDLEDLRSCWGQIKRFCLDIPSALTHGDFVAKNLRVRASISGLTVVPFDWEISGWGPPAADLGASAGPELPVYWSIINEVWPALSLQFVQQVSLIGRAFRLAAAIDWGCADFSPAWPEGMMCCMVKYKTRLLDLLEIAPWNN